MTFQIRLEVLGKALWRDYGMPVVVNNKDNFNLRAAILLKSVAEIKYWRGKVWVKQEHLDVVYFCV